MVEVTRADEAAKESWSSSSIGRSRFVEEKKIENDSRHDRFGGSGFIHKTVTRHEARLADDERIGRAIGDRYGGAFRGPVRVPGEKVNPACEECNGK